MSDTKKKSRKSLTLLLLLLILGLLLLLLAGLRTYNKRAEEKAEKDAAGITMMSVDVDKVQSFSYPYEGTVLTFTQNDGEWTNVENPTVDLDDDMVKSMLNASTELTTDTIVTQDLSEAASYGLDDPSFTLTVQEKDGSSSVLHVGDENPMVAVCYAYVEGDDRIFAMDKTFVSSFVGLDELKEQDDEEDTDTDAEESVIEEDDSVDLEEDAADAGDLEEDAADAGDLEEAETDDSQSTSDN